MIAAAAALVGGDARGVPVPPAAGRPFILTCDCATDSERRRIAEAIVARGATILYLYPSLPGLAFVTPTGENPAAFAAGIRRLSGIRDVRRGRTSRLHAR